MSVLHVEEEPRIRKSGEISPVVEDESSFGRRTSATDRIRSRRPEDARAEDGDRGISPVGASTGGPTRNQQAFGAIAMAGGLGALTIWGLFGAHPQARAAAPVKPASQQVPYEPPPSLVTRPPASSQGPDGQPIVAGAALPGTAGTPGATGATVGVGPGAAAPGTVPGVEPTANTAPASGGAGVMTPAQKREAMRLASIRAPLMAFNVGGASPQGGESQPGFVRTADQAGAGGVAAPPSELDRLRQGSTIVKARARMIGDRNYLVLAGASLPCVLLTALDSSTPGYVTCVIPRDIYSDNGRIVLMEKGTKVVGEYRSGMRQGQRRLFVLWDRAVTPAGVAIDVASPASDSLGRSGFEGRVESFFWERFGAAILFSVVDGASSIASQRLAESQNNGAPLTIAQAPSNTAAVALQNQTNIPPVLRKNQGGEVSIMVAQDFDFSAVYAVKPR